MANLRKILGMLLPLRKARIPWTKPIPQTFRSVPVSRVFHPKALAEWKEHKPFHSTHLIEYPNGRREYHYDLGNPNYPGLMPKLAYLAEESTRWGTAGGVGLGAYYGIRHMRRRRKR